MLCHYQEIRQNKRKRSLQLAQNLILPQMTIILFNTKCCGELYQKYRGLNKIYIPSFDTHVRVLCRIWADGEQRRIDMGKNVGHLH